MTGNARGGDRILGSLRSADGKGIVRMQDRFDTDIDDLWSAITDPGRLARWIGEVEGDLRLGGDFRAHFFSSGWEGTGRVEACEPPRRLLLVTKLADAPDASLPIKAWPPPSTDMAAHPTRHEPLGRWLRTRDGQRPGVKAGPPVDGAAGATRTAGLRVLRARRSDSQTAVRVHAVIY